MTKKLLANCRFDFISTLSVNKTLKHVGSNPHRNFEAASFLIPIDSKNKDTLYGYPYFFRIWGWT